MASKALASTALLLSLNLLFFTLMSSCNCLSSPSPSPPPQKPKGPSSNPTSKPSNSSRSPSNGGVNCPKLGVCVDLFKNLLGITIGQPPTTPCCSLLAGLVDLDAAVCLCTTIRANILGIINLNLPIDLSLVLNNCGKKVPDGFTCA